MNEPFVNPEIGQQIRDWRPYHEAKLYFRNRRYPALFAAELAGGGR